MPSRTRQRRWNGQRFEQLTKAVNPNFEAMARAAGDSVQPRAFPLLDAINAATGEITANGGVYGEFRAMPRDPRDDNAFGPMDPLRPEAIDLLDSDGRTEPRTMVYPVGWNLPGNGNRETPWAVLRAASMGVGIIRRCIEARKKDICDLELRFGPSEDAINDAYQANPSAGRLDAEQKLREELLPDINRLREFWLRPWRSKSWGFKQWARAALEDILVIDALPIYPRRTYGGDVYDLELIDGTTIKPLLDVRGNPPLPPYPALQQILYGFPRGEWAATVEYDDEGNAVLANGFQSSEMMYYVANPRTYSPFGFSPVEQALFDSRLYLQRQKWMLAEYEDGSTPLTWVETAAPSDGQQMTLTQQRLWEKAFNSRLSGNTRERVRARVLPNGWKAMMMATTDERYKPEYDLYLIKLLCGHFGLTATRLGFGESNGLGGSGFSEGQMAVTGELGLKPDTEVLTEIINQASCHFLGMDKRIKAIFVDPSESNTSEQATITDTQVKGGQISINEARQKVGQSLLPFEEANKPFILGGPNGIIFLEGAQKQIDAAMQAQQMQAETAALGTAGKLSMEEQKLADGKEAREAEHELARETRDVTLEAQQKSEVNKSAEIRAFRAWRAKPANAGDQPRRPFLFKSVEPDDGWPELDGLGPLVAAFEGWEWQWDESIEKAAKRAGKNPFDYIEWNARNPLHPKGPNGRWVKRGSDLHTALVEEGERHAKANAPKAGKPSGASTTLQGMTSKLGAPEAIRINKVEPGMVVAIRGRVEAGSEGLLVPRKVVSRTVVNGQHQLTFEDGSTYTRSPGRAMNLYPEEPSPEGEAPPIGAPKSTTTDERDAREWREWAMGPTRPIQAYTIDKEETGTGAEKHGIILPAGRNGYITRDDNKVRLRDVETDEILFSGSSMPDVWRKVSKFYGAPVQHEHEGTGRVKQFGEAGDPLKAPAAAEYGAVPTSRSTQKLSEVSIGSKVEWTDSQDGTVRKGEVISHTKSSAKVKWAGGRVELVKLNDKELRFFAGETPDAETVARARQARIDAVKPKAEFLAEVEEGINTGADSATLRRMVEQSVRRNNLADDPVAGMVQLNMDRGALNTAAAAWGLRRIGDEGTFDPAMHKPIGDRPSVGGDVELVKPGYVFRDGGEDIQLMRAVVDARITEPELNDDLDKYPGLAAPLGSPERMAAAQARDRDDARAASNRALVRAKQESARTEARERFNSSNDPRDNGPKVKALISGTIDAADLYRKAEAGPSGQRKNVHVGRVRFRDNQHGEFQVVDKEGRNAGWMTRVDRNGETMYVVHSEDYDGGIHLEGWADSVSLGADVLVNGKHAATGRHGSRRISTGKFEAYVPKTEAQIDREEAAKQVAWNAKVAERQAEREARAASTDKPGIDSAGFVTSPMNAHSLGRGDEIILKGERYSVVGVRRDSLVVMLTAKTATGGIRTFNLGVNQPVQRITGGNLRKAAVPDDGPGDADPKAQEPVAAPPPAPDTRWPGWLLDMAIATVVMNAILGAMPGLPIGELISLFKRLQRSWPKDLPTWREMEPQARRGTVERVLWELRQDGWPVRMAGVLRDPILSAHVEGHFVGQQVGRAVADATLDGHDITNPDAALRLSINWSDWTPGHPEAARLLIEPGGLERLLRESNVVIDRLAAGRLDQIGRIIGEGLADGLSPREIAGRLRALVNDPDWAMMTAVTETNRAMSAASVMQYREAGLLFKGWMTAFDQRVCKICAKNERHSDGRPRIVPIDELFPSGDPWPPGHPRCRCAPIPVLNSMVPTPPAREAQT